MGIDLFTLIAQIINLVILLYLLRRFLYIPVLKAVEQRQQPDRPEFMRCR